MSVGTSVEAGALWGIAAVGALASALLGFDPARDAASKGASTTRTVWWAAVRAGLLPTTAPMPTLRAAPDRVVGRTEGPSRWAPVLHALLALGVLSALLSTIVFRGVGDLNEEGAEVFALAVLIGLPGLAWGVWNVALALAPSADGAVVLEADADELWIQLREARGAMPTPRNVVQTRSWPWPAIRSAALRGPRDGTRLRYLGLYLTDPNGVEYTYDLTDIEVSVGELEAMLTERAGVQVQVHVTPE